MRIEVVDDVGIIWVETLDIKAIMLYKTNAEEDDPSATIKICTSYSTFNMLYKDNEHAAKVAQQLKEFV